MVQLKIKLSEDESHEFILSPTMSIREAEVLIAKLQSLVRIASKIETFDKPEINSNPEKLKLTMDKIKRKEMWKIVRNNRDLIVKIFYTYYNSKGNEELKNIFEKNGIGLLFEERKILGGGIWLQLRKQFKIRPDEVNLKRFVQRGEIITNDFRIKTISYLK